MATAVRIDGPLAVVEFAAPFDLDSYALFLRAKQLPERQVTYDAERDAYRLTTPARFAPLLGAEATSLSAEPLPLAEHLFDYQRFIVEVALAARRYAVWADTGLGKTAIEQEFARQVVALTGGKVLILTPLQVIRQFIDMAATFYGDGLPMQHLHSREALLAWCRAPGSGIAITNPEKFIEGQVPELRLLAGLVFDESSLLKSGGGTIKWNLIHSARGIEYKLSCTATPAPNDTMEYASQASFLEKLRTEGEILWTFFTRDTRGDWRVKPHARDAFYRFMASWSVYLRNPAHFGFADLLSTLPLPEIYEYTLPITPVQQELAYGLMVKKGGGLFMDDRLGVQERSKLSQLAKGFLYQGQGAERQVARIDSAKPSFVANLVRADVADGRQVLVWTVFDAESAIVAEHLAAAAFEVAVLDGSMSETARAEILDRFRAGAVQVLISKAQLVGYGLNFQFCRSMVFSGFDDSFERLYQAVRRAYRYGQTERVRVHVPYIPELEGMIYTNIKRKQALFDADTAQMEREYQRAMASLLPTRRAA